MKRMTVLLADDHAIVREGIRRILEPQYEIVGEVEDGRALLEAAGRLRPQVIVADVAMPNLNGLEAMRQLGRMGVRSKVVFVTMHANVEYAIEAIELGASGYLLKHDAADELLKAIVDALAGRTHITPRIAEEVEETMRDRIGRTGRSSTTALTRREREVLQLVAEGNTMRQIASILDVSPKTVEFHKSNLKKKLHLGTTAELTRYALEHGFITTEG